MRCISWNIGKNYKILEKQLKIIEDTNPEILALQEVTEKTFLEIEKKIKSKFKFIYFSLNSINKKSLLIGPRKLGVLTASNFKLIPRPDDEFDVPWRERILNLDVFTGKDKFIFYNSYIPPGSSNGWIKIETLEGIFKGLNKKKRKTNYFMWRF